MVSNGVAAPPVALWQPLPGEFPGPNRQLEMPDWLQPVAENWFWVALGLILVGVGVWYLAQARTEDGMPLAATPAAEETVPPAESRRPKGAVAGKAGNKAIPESHASLGAPPAEVEPPRAGRTATATPTTDLPRALGARETPVPDRSPSSPSPPPPRTPAMTPAITSPAAAKPEPAGVLPAGVTTPRGSQFAGNWLYVPDPSEKSAPGAYPATYVELLMGEEHGRLRGTYRAEYRIADRAVSPEVAFQVEGDAPAETTAHLQWTAADGAKGDVDLALTGPNVLRISWWTTEFGRHTKLASGSSRLIRQLSR